MTMDTHYCHECGYLKDQPRCAVCLLLKKKRELKAELKEARGVIEFYGGEEMWDLEEDYYGEPITPAISIDGGKHAREYLTKYTKEDKDHGDKGTKNSVGQRSTSP